MAHNALKNLKIVVDKTDFLVYPIKVAVVQPTL